MPVVWCIFWLLALQLCDSAKTFLLRVKYWLRSEKASAPDESFAINAYFLACSYASLALS